MVLYKEVCMWGPKGEDLDHVRDFLRSRGLVDPDGTYGESAMEGIFVWEDASGEGRFRVHTSHEPGSGAMKVYFRYWQNGRVTPEVDATDPMLGVVRECYDSFEFSRVTVGSGGSIDEEFSRRP